MPQQTSVRELAAKLLAGEPVFLLDVRQPQEHEFARLADSVLVPLPELLSRIEDATPPPGVPIVVYCHHGVRSLSGAAILERAGITPVYSLAGGIDAWSLQIDPTIPRY